jgi:imidazolonepropionase-like amidohydrolase
MRLLFLFASLLVAAITVAQTQKPSGVADFISIDRPLFVIDHVRVIDGTGTPPTEEQAVAIANGKIQFIGPEASAQIPERAQRIDRSGYTVIPGIVGMHNHLYYTDSYSSQLSAERLASRDYSLRRFLTRHRDSIWRLA